ncbi:MAG: glycoside hydrolase family 31 [Bacteroidetes bacterium 4484_276]|nr:MAG: glycoside hydrolase family 31 [Bacteroidetes bacterium 4484_276]
MKKIIVILTSLLMASVAISQNQLSNSLGNVNHIKKDNGKQTFTFETDNGTAVVTLMSPNIFRVRIAKAFGPDISYAVVGEAIRGNFDYGEDDNEFFVSSDSLVLKVSKKPLRFTFETKGGKVISQDDPEFGTSWIGTEVSAYKTLQDGEKFIGLGEKTGNLDRRGEAYVNWNTDNPHYDNNTDPIYASIPFYIGIHHGLNYGIFLDNSYRSVFNFGASNDRFSYFSADDGEMDYYFIYHEKISDIIKSYTWLTGRMELPPLWALGYQQCRWSYTPHAEVLDIAATFRQKKIPADVIYLDIGYMDSYKIFTWHPENFPNPEKLISDLKKMDFRTAVIIDPGIKVEEGYQAYDEGIAYDHFVKYPDGKPWTAQVWPGWCHFPDFTQPETRDWWGEKFMGYVNLGVEGFWNDMNEIATWGQQPPNLIEFAWEGNKTTYRQAKNVYGMEMARSTFEGTKKLMDGRRPLIITRAGFAGLQRYTSIWTGDNHATDHHMMLGVRLVNSLGLSGISFTGSDVGGFGGNATPELFARWVQIGAFTPFFRGHSAINTASAEPWVFGEQTERVARNYIQLRYNLLPYVYTAIRESTQSGMPVNRSLAINYTSDEKVFWRIYQNQYIFGPSLLIIPVESDKQLTTAYLPEGEWYDFYTDEKFSGKQEITAKCPGDKLPVYVKAGSMVPMQSPIQSTAQMPSDTLQVHLYKSDHVVDLEWGYYEDDGVTYNFKEGEYYMRTMVYKPSINEVTFNPRDGKFTGKFEQIQLVFHGFGNLGSIVKFDGKPRRIEMLTMNFQHAAEKPATGHPSTITCPSIIFPNKDSKIVINW